MASGGDWNRAGRDKQIRRRRHAQARLPLSKANFHKILLTASLLNVKIECEIEAIVYLTAKGCDSTPQSIDLALYLDMPDDSMLLSEVINMNERPSEIHEPGNGINIRLFDGSEERDSASGLKARL